MQNTGLKEEILLDQVQHLEQENAERNRLLSKIDQIMMKSEDGGALAPYMDYITKLKEENTRLKIIEKERDFIKEELRIYDEATLIGTLGGFLGLFVGFSFYDTLCYFIDIISSLL